MARYNFICQYSIHEAYICCIGRETQTTLFQVPAFPWQSLEDQVWQTCSFSSNGQVGLYKKLQSNLCILEFIPCAVFFFFVCLLFGNLFFSITFSITFFQPTRVDAHEFCSVVGWAIYNLIYGSYRDLLPTFSPTGVFFRQVFSGPRLTVE